MNKTYPICVDCANCALLMEEAIRKMEEVESVSISFMSQKITLSFSDDIPPEKLIRKVEKVCRKIEPDCEIDF